MKILSLVNGTDTLPFQCVMYTVSSHFLHLYMII